MGTFTWVQGGFSSGANITAVARPDVNLLIPATGIVRRFQVRNNNVQGEQSTTSVTGQPLFSVESVVVFTDAANVPRTIFTSNLAVPAQCTALYDVATLERVYATFHNAGDRELEINQGCAYGKHTDTGHKFMTYQSGISQNTPGALNAAGAQSFVFAVLYETIP